jgi:hypothetical protein
MGVPATPVNNSLPRTKLEKFEPWLATLLIILIAASAFLLLTPKQGFTEEDWQLIWTGRNLGAQGFVTYYEIDRPLAGYIYAAVYPLLGEQPWPWHFAAFLLRLTGALSVFWLLRMLFPHWRLLTFTAALLFILYPGYLQQPNAVNKIFWLTSLTAALLSLTLTIYALNLKKTAARVGVTILALLLAVIYPLIIEFYIGFEAVRFLLIWYVFWGQKRLPLRQSLLAAIKWFLPYFIVAIAFLFWRVFLFQSSRPSTDLGRIAGSYSTNPLYMLVRLIFETLIDFFETVFLAWAVPFYQLLRLNAYYEIFLALLLGLGVAVLYLGYVYLIHNRIPRPSTSEVPHHRDLLAAIVLGTLITFATLIPMILAGREVNFDFSTRADHYTIQASLGATLLLAALIWEAAPRYKIPAATVLLVIGMMTQFLNGQFFVNRWEIQRNLWWQLSWRAPDLEDGTLLFTELPAGYDLRENYEIWAPANLVYRPGSPDIRIAGEILDRQTAQDIIRGTLKEREVRGAPVIFDFNKALILSMLSPQSCLKVNDGLQVALTSDEEPLLQLVAPYSHIHQVVPGAAPVQPPVTIFGPEPKHDWCYYYQTASLARQQGDWEKIGLLGKQAQAAGYSPLDPAEWLPFMEAYAATGNEKEARSLAAIIRTRPELRTSICKQLELADLQPAGYPADFIAEFICQIPN